MNANPNIRALKCGWIGFPMIVPVRLAPMADLRDVKGSRIVGIRPRFPFTYCLEFAVMRAMLKGWKGLEEALEKNHDFQPNSGELGHG